MLGVLGEEAAAELTAKVESWRDEVGGNVLPTLDKADGRPWPNSSSTSRSNSALCAAARGDSERHAQPCERRIAEWDSCARRCSLGRVACLGWRACGRTPRRSAPRKPRGIHRAAAPQRRQGLAADRGRAPTPGGRAERPGPSCCPSRRSIAFGVRPGQRLPNRTVSFIPKSLACSTARRSCSTIGAPPRLHGAR
jgi:hypothetical protein